MLRSLLPLAIVALALTSCAVLGDECAKYGYKKLAAANDTTVLTTVSKCCEKDATLCGGMASADKTCDEGSFWDSEKQSVKAGADAAAHKANCCTAKPTCKDVTCNAGYKKKTGVDATKCVSTKAETCAGESTCCEKDDTKCGGLAELTCDAGSYRDSEKNGVAAGAAAADHKTNCCTAQSTCKDATCTNDYYKKKTGVDATKCNGATGCGGSTCCELDDTKCGGLASLDCGDGFYRDSTKRGTVAGTTDADKKKNCCKARSTCKDFWDGTLNSGLRPLPTLAAMSIVAAVASFL